MARYKPRSTVAKQVANTTEVRKTADEKRWEIGMAKHPDKVLPAIALDATPVQTDDSHLVPPGYMTDDEKAATGYRPKVAELVDFALRREATAALDELLEAIDSLPPDAVAQVPTETAIRMALEALADRLVA